MTDAPLGDNPTDKTVENAEELGGGYGGPFPAEPEKESDTSADTGLEEDEAQSPT